MSKISHDNAKEWEKGTAAPGIMNELGRTKGEQIRGCAVIPKTNNTSFTSIAARCNNNKQVGEKSRACRRQKLVLI